MTNFCGDGIRHLKGDIKMGGAGGRRGGGEELRKRVPPS